MGMMHFQEVVLKVSVFAVRRLNPSVLFFITHLEPTALVVGARSNFRPKFD